EPRHASVDAASHILRDPFGFIGEAIQEISVDRQRRRRRNLRYVGKRFLERQVAVRLSPAERASCRGGSERLESQMLQVNGGSDVPRIRQDKAALIVQASKGRDRFVLIMFHGATYSVELPVLGLGFFLPFRITNILCSAAGMLFSTLNVVCCRDNTCFVADWALWILLSAASLAA